MSTVLKIDIEDDEQAAFELKQVFKNLQDDDYAYIYDTLLRFDWMIYGGITTFSIFNEMFRSLLPNLNKHVLNVERPQICGKVCTTIEILCIAMKDAFEPFTEHLLPNLLEVTRATSDVILTFGHHCIMTIICNSRIAKLCVQRIVEGATGRDLQHKKRCIEYIRLMLSAYSFHFLTPFEDILAECISQMSTDQQLLAIAPVVYDEFKTMFPNHNQRKETNEISDIEILDSINKNRGLTRTGIYEKLLKVYPNEGPKLWGKIGKLMESLIQKREKYDNIVKKIEREQDIVPSPKDEYPLEPKNPEKSEKSKEEDQRTNSFYSL